MIRNKEWCTLLGVGVVMILGVGCSTGPEESTTPPTTQETRGDSDRFFQKMEQEENKKNSSLADNAH